MKYIKRKSAVKPITGSIVDTTNIDDKTTNTYSARIINEMNTYSTEEYFTGKYWIDGKPIYGKVIDLGLIPDTNIIINYSVEIGVENVIDYKGRMVSSQVCSLLPVISGEIKAELNVYSVNQVIFIDLIRSLPSAWIDRNLVVTLEYTKTTD